MKKTLLTLGAVALLSTTYFPETTGYAQTQTMEQTQKELSDVNRQIEKLNQAIQDNENMITETEKNIQNSQKELEELQKETNEIQNRIDARSSIIENRLRALQVQGSEVTYLDVLLSAHSFADLIDRVSAIATLMQADQNLMEEQKSDAEEILKKEQNIQEELTALEEKKTDLLGMKSQIEEQKNQSLNTKESLEQQRKEQEAYIEQLNAQQTNKQITTETTRSVKTTNVQTVASTKPITPPTTTATTPASGNVQTVISAGNKYIGNSVYVFGGGRSASDITNGRFDCSGFVSWAFKQAGVSVPAYTGGLTGVGKRVSVSEMKPGDLVFFDTYKKDGHVGIYVGNGKFIGSQSSTGVAIADMSKGYWKDTFNGRVNRVF